MFDDTYSMADFNIGQLWDSFQDLLNQNNVPEICLGVMGVLILAIVFAYRDNDDALTYKALVALGVIFGAFMLYVALAVNTGWTVGTLLVCSVACFALVIRPFREINISLLLAVIVMVWVYIFLGTFQGASMEILGQTVDLSFLGDGLTRIVISVVAGSFIYMVGHFVEALAKLAGKILNAWPFLMVIAIWCILETIMLFAGYGSIYDFFSSAF